MDRFFPSKRSEPESATWFPGFLYSYYCTLQARSKSHVVGFDTPSLRDRQIQLGESLEPETMKAATIEKTGGPEVIQIDDVPRPDPKDGEILVRVGAAALNPI